MGYGHEQLGDRSHWRYGMGEGSKRPTANAQGSALQLKLTLRGVSKPPVWRRLVVAADTRLHLLHDVIQTSMFLHLRAPPPRRPDMPSATRQLL
jgi:Plasmid pRiA4b ORF-3-like protein